MHKQQHRMRALHFYRNRCRIRNRIGESVARKSLRISLRMCELTSVWRNIWVLGDADDGWTQALHWVLVNFVIDVHCQCGENLNIFFRAFHVVCRLFSPVAEMLAANCFHWIFGQTHLQFLIWNKQLNYYCITQLICAKNNAHSISAQFSN